MLNIREKMIKVGDKELFVKTGEYALQANGSITIKCGETLVQAIAVMGDENPDLDFFPLQVEYNENLYAGGKIKSSRFLKREGRPSDDAILRARLIDRSIRPMFPKDFRREVQVIINILASDKENPHDVLGLTAAICSLAVSDIPFNGHLAGIRLSLVNGEFIVNPTYEQCSNQDFELILAGNEQKIIMVECAAKCVEDEKVLKGMELAYGHLGQLTAAIDEIAAEFGREKVEFTVVEDDEAIYSRIEKQVEENIEQYSTLLSGKKAEKSDFKKIIIEPILASFTDEEKEEDFPEKKIKAVIDKIFKKYIRANILKNQKRIDGRALDEIREINIDIKQIPRVHGSSMFMRGETQVLNILTLAAPGNEQLLEAIEGETEKRYLHHYNAPPYSVGETGRYGSPGRREIGHGALAEKALLPVLPLKEEFSYVIRLVSEVMGQNGSSSMASTCASTLTLMDGGVPIKAPVAGISIGLMTGENDDEFVTLTDIVGYEDFGGDMDFKVAGTYDEITAIQMDTKIHGLTYAVVQKAIQQAKEARRKILDKIKTVIDKPREELSIYAPKIDQIKVNVDDISKVIGSGGKVIKQLSSENNVEISIDDSGVANIAGDNVQDIENVKRIINGIVSDPNIGEIYPGKVARLLDFGAIVEIFPGKDGLVHVSRISKEHVKDIRSVLSIGQKVEVKLIEIDSQNRLNFSMLLDDEVKKSKSPHRTVHTRRRNYR